jgi:hypothetical protein
MPSTEAPAVRSSIVSRSMKGSAPGLPFPTRPGHIALCSAGNECWDGMGATILKDNGRLQALKWWRALVSHWKTRRPTKGSLERFRNRVGPPANRTIFDLKRPSGRNAATTGDAKQRATIDHRLPCFRHRRNAKLHSSGEGLPVPWRIQTTVVLFPYSQPRKV